MPKPTNTNSTETQPEPSNVFVYGRGTIWTQQGVVKGHRSLAINRLPKGVSVPVGTKPKQWKTEREIAECDAVLVFETLEGARVLQDELNELVSTWSREAATEIDYKTADQV